MKMAGLIVLFSLQALWELSLPPRSLCSQSRLRQCHVRSSSQPSQAEHPSSSDSFFLSYAEEDGDLQPRQSTSCTFPRFMVIGLSCQALHATQVFMPGHPPSLLLRLYFRNDYSVACCACHTPCAQVPVPPCNFPLASHASFQAVCRSNRSGSPLHTILSVELPIVAIYVFV